MTEPKARSKANAQAVGVEPAAKRGASPGPLHDLLAGKWEDGTRRADLFASRVSREPERYLPELLAGLASRERRVQGVSAELCSPLSAASPQHLAPHAALFLANLEAKAPILRWEAACTVGNLAAVADVRAALEPLASNLDDKSIVLQGHSVRALAKLARAHPPFAARILDALLASELRFPGKRVGFLVEAMEAFDTPPALAAQARAFAERHRASTVTSVAQKARRALKKLG